MEQGKVNKEKQPEAEMSQDAAAQAVASAVQQEKFEGLGTETDDLLDEIDDVLEENAEEFVKSYIQKGGQ